MTNITQGFWGDTRESCGSSVVAHGTKPSSSRSINKIARLDGINYVVA